MDYEDLYRDYSRDPFPSKHQRVVVDMSLWDDVLRGFRV